MMCPVCGPKGHLEQVQFSSEFEQYYCTVCGNKYISYALGNGEFSEPVPVISKK